MKNIHYYVRDPDTGTIFRTVGYTYLDELIVYPKYIPSLNGDRGEGVIKYRGINYPNGSVKFLADNKITESSNVAIKFNELFYTFLPVAEKSKLILYNPTTRLFERMKENTERGILLKKLVNVLSEYSGVAIENFGLDASTLVGMDKEGSDIDLVVYGKENARSMRKFWEELEKDNKNEITKPNENPEIIVKRRQAYSPLMTEEEIVLWEECKISGYFKGIKFSVMPIDDEGRYKFKYLSTGQFVGARIFLENDEILCDPGILNLERHKTKIVYGPSNLSLTQFITFLPSRMGIFLKKGDCIFVLGKIYAIRSKDCKNIKFALAQFPWDDRSYLGESYFVVKKEKCDLTHMISTLLGLNFSNSYFTE